MTTESFTQKDPAEIIPLTFDFERLVMVIDSVTWSITVKQGADPNVGDMLFGAPTNVGGKTSHLIRNGVDGVVYLLRADVVSGQEKYAEVGYLQVKTLA